MPSSHRRALAPRRRRAHHQHDRDVAGGIEGQLQPVAQARAGRLGRVGAQRPVDLARRPRQQAGGEERPAEPVAADEHRAQQAQHRARDDHAVVDPGAEEGVEPVGRRCRARSAASSAASATARSDRAARGPPAGWACPCASAGSGPLSRCRRFVRREACTFSVPIRVGLLGALGAAEVAPSPSAVPAALDRAAADARDADADLGLLAGLDRVGLVADLLEAACAAGGLCALACLRLLAAEALERDDAGAAAERASPPGS